MIEMLSAESDHKFVHALVRCYQEITALAYHPTTLKIYFTNTAPLTAGVKPPLPPPPPPRPLPGPPLIPLFAPRPRFEYRLATL